MTNTIQPMTNMSVKQYSYDKAWERFLQGSCDPSSLGIVHMRALLDELYIHMGYPKDFPYVAGWNEMQRLLHHPEVAQSWDVVKETLEGMWSEARERLEEGYAHLEPVSWQRHTVMIVRVARWACCQARLHGQKDIRPQFYMWRDGWLACMDMGQDQTGLEILHFLMDMSANASNTIRSMKEWVRHITQQEEFRALIESWMIKQDTLPLFLGQTPEEHLAGARECGLKRYVAHIEKQELLGHLLMSDHPLKCKIM